MNEEKLMTSVKCAEALKLTAYQDSKGVWTIGYGRNLQTMKIPQHLAEEWVAEDIYTAVVEAKKFSAYAHLDTDARQNAFVEMCYNLGATRLSGFHDMLGAICVGDWEEAAAQALDSKWHKDIGKRAERIAEMLRTGKFQE